MTKEDAFRNYLATCYRSPKTRKAMSSKVISDTISRCKRVERCLDVDLYEFCRKGDRGLRAIIALIKSNATAFGYDGSRPYFYTIFNYSVKHYYRFVDSLKQG